MVISATAKTTKRMVGSISAPKVMARLAAELGVGGARLGAGQGDRRTRRGPG